MQLAYSVLNLCLEQKIAIEKMQVGEVLTVLADDPASEDDISKWVNRTGHELLSMNKNDKVFEFTIKKVK